MLKAMVFIDFENFDIAKYQYYKKKCERDHVELCNPKLDYNKFPLELVKLLSQPHALVKTLLFAPKPDDFLMKDKNRSSTYNWITGMKNQNYFTVIEGSHVARPVSGYTYNTMSLEKHESYYVEEKGTDVNLATNIITKGMHNAFDTAIIMSGDTDYLPVYEVMNSIGKSVVVVGVEGQNLSKFRHYSDAQIIINDDFFKKCLRK